MQRGRCSRRDHSGRKCQPEMGRDLPRKRERLRLHHLWDIQEDATRRRHWKQHQLEEALDGWKDCPWTRASIPVIRLDEWEKEVW